MNHQKRGLHRISRHPALPRKTRNSGDECGADPAQGMRPVPAEYGPRHPAPFELSLWDHLGHICSTHSVAMVDRSAQIRETHVRRRDSLYAGPTSTSSEARETGVLHDSYGSEFSRFRSRRNRETVDTETRISKKTGLLRAHLT